MIYGAPGLGISVCRTHFPPVVQARLKVVEIGIWIMTRHISRTAI